MRELAAVVSAHPAIEAELARRAAYKIRGYFHNCDPDGCVPHSANPDDHVIRPNRKRPSCRVLYARHCAFFRAGATYRQRMLLGGNRTGKTDEAAFECTLHLTGTYPDWWEGRRFGAPVEIWAAGDTSTTTRDIIQQAFLGPLAAVNTKQWAGMIPAHLVADTSRKHGIPDAIETIWVTHVSGGLSFINLKSYDQRREAFQGTGKHVIWLDEEPDEEIYGECLMRTMTTDGLILTTLTPLQGLTQFIDHYLQRSIMEVLDEQGVSQVRPAKSAVFHNDGPTPQAVEPDVEGLSRYVVMVGWDDCPHLDEQAKTELAAEYLPSQLEARSRGVPSLGAGAIYPVPESDTRVNSFEIPPHWPRAFAMDTGWNWTAAVWGARDRETGTLYIYSVYKRGQAEPPIHAEAIKARGAWIPGVGDAAAINNSDGQQFLAIYQRLGLDLHLADKAVEAGIQDVWQLLSAGKLKVFDSCGPWFDEFRLYRRDEKGRIIKKDDHLMDPTRYLVRSGVARMKPHPSTKPKPSRYDRSYHVPNPLAWMG